MSKKGIKDNDKLRKLMEEYGVKTLEGVHSFVKMLTTETIQTALDAELEQELGYSKYDYKHKKTDISSIEDKVIFLYSQGVSNREIEATMREMYGIDVDDSRVSEITDKLLPIIREQQERPLQSVYAMVILDTVHYKVRENGVVVKKAAYVALSTDLEGRKDVLGIWLGATESSKYWLNVLTTLKNRGVKDILIVSVDGLSGFIEAIHVAFPNTEVQRCIIHQIRASTRYVSYKDLKAFSADLKPVYKAVRRKCPIGFG